MQSKALLTHDPEFGSFVAVDRLPLVRLRERRRELVLSLQDPSQALTRERIAEIADLQQAINAIEAVLSE